LAFALIVVIGISLSGCCCCCGFDGFTSKYQKPITNLKFPSTLNIGGKLYSLTKSIHLPTPADCRNEVIKALKDEGVDAAGQESNVDSAISLMGLQEALTFEYSDPSGHKQIGGFVSKSDSPGKLQAAFVLGSQLVPQYPEIVVGPAYTAADETHLVETDELHDYAYIAVTRYSNMLIYVVSFESYDHAKAGLNMAIQAIDSAAA
jgi:hypothetical protein